MSSSQCANRRSPEPVRADLAELALPTRPLVQKLGRVRVPLSLTHQPWATAYRLPNGRTVWCLTLRQDGELVRAVVPTRVLRRYARRSGLAELEAAIDYVAGPEVD
jgi:hypothetical protein